MQQRPPSFGLDSGGLIPTASFGLNSGGLSPTMNAAAATLFWSQFSRPQPDDEKQASFGLNSAGLSMAMNTAVATLFFFLILYHINIMAKKMI
jgi:hypothetical protein